MRFQIKYFVLFIALVALGLTCACSNGPSKTTGALTPVNTDSTSPSASIRTLDDIISTIKADSNTDDIKIVNTTNVGPDWSLVEYTNPNYNEFLLYNSQTGNYDNLSRDAKLLMLENENHIIFEIKGDYSEDGFNTFPYIEECIRQVDAGTEHNGFYFETKPEYYTLDRSVKGGSKDSDKLSVVSVTLDGLELLFKPADGAAGNTFYAAASDIPPTVTSYDKSTNQLTIELDKCQLDSKVKPNVEIKTDDNGYISAYKVVVENNSIYIVMTLRQTAEGYTLDINKIPDVANADGFPYLSISFVNKDTMSSLSDLGYLASK